ncbi:MAG: SDR family oxidoreductase [Actinobacteria bacterium]|nr:MAG: SDR family oxidoreductase [Actinomycetota bacterium]
MGGVDGAPEPATASGAAPGRGRLTGRRVLVVGGGQQDHGLEDPPIGNGRAMAVLSAREGAAVAVADIDRDSAERSAQGVRAEGAAAVVLVGDAADDRAVASMFSDARDGLGGLDGVVLNVGVGAGLLLRGTTVDDWDRVMAINTRSQFLGCKYALQTMSEGAVVLVGSVAAREVLPFPAYGASKAALESLCRQAAVEGAPSIRFNLVHPGLIDTPLGRQASAISARRERVRIPARRQGTGWEVAYTALFLLGEESSYITGQSVIVDGGLTIGPRG